MFATLLFFGHHCLWKILDDVRTVCVPRTGFAASSGQQDRLVAGRLRALVLDVPALNACHDSSLFLHRYTFTFDAVHDAEWGTQVGEPCGSEFT